MTSSARSGGTPLGSERLETEARLGAARPLLYIRTPATFWISQTDLERTTGAISQFTSTEKLFRVRARLSREPVACDKGMPRYPCAL